MVFLNAMSVPNPNPTPNPSNDDVIDLVGPADSATEEAEVRVRIDDVAGKTLLIYRAEELPSRFGKGTYFRLYAEVEETGQKVTFTVPNRHGRDIVEHMRRLKAQINQGKKVRARIIRETYHYHRYVLGAPSKRAQRTSDGGGRK
jgi:hypothetical protein